MEKIMLKILKLFFSEYSFSKLRELFLELKNDFLQIGLKLRVKRLKQKPPYKLNLGCGPDIKKGWINTDINKPAELRFDMRRGLPFPDESCEVIYSEHLLEHLSYPKEIEPFLKECFRVLKKGGVMHAGVPDGGYTVEVCMQKPLPPGFLQKLKEHPEWYPKYCKTGFEFINYLFRLDDYSGGSHKYAYDFQTLKAHLERAGFSNVHRREFDSEIDNPFRIESLYVTAEKAEV